MGRTGDAPSRASCRRWAARRRATRGALAGALVAVVLLLCGAVDVLPRSAPGPLAAAPATAASASSQRTGAVEAPSSSLGARAAGLAAVPVPTGPGGGLPPDAGPLLAPHLLADPQSRPPTTPPATSPAGSPGSRAPPGLPGT